MPRHAAHGIEFDALKIAPQLEVDDTGEGVRAVDRGGAASDHLDALDQHRWNDIDVDDPGAVRRHQPPPVEQHQGGGRGQSAQREVALTSVTGVIRRAAEGRDELWKPIQHALHCNRRGLLETRGANRHDRAGGCEIRSSDSRARDDDFFQRRVLGNSRQHGRQGCRARQQSRGTTPLSIRLHAAPPCDSRIQPRNHRRPVPGV